MPVALTFSRVAKDLRCKATTPSCKDPGNDNLLSSWTGTTQVEGTPHLGPGDEGAASPCVLQPQESTEPGAGRPHLFPAAVSKCWIPPASDDRTKKGQLYLL